MTTYKELLAQRAKLDAEIDRIRSEEREAIIVEILEKIADYKIELSELEEKRSRGRPKFSKTGTVAAKYRDPHSGKEWSGRGKMPNWIKFADDREKFRVSE